MRLDHDENQGLVPTRVAPRHLWCHPDVPRRNGNVRTFQNLVPHLDPSLVKKRPEASVYNAKNMTPILARILGTVFYLYDPSALLRS